jgi:hypothetical protein
MTILAASWCVRTSPNNLLSVSTAMRRTQEPLCAVRDWEACARGAQSNGRRHVDTRRRNEPPAPESFVIFSLSSGDEFKHRGSAESRDPRSHVVTIHSRGDYHRIRRSVLSSAPAGTTAVSKNRHKATNSFLASATIPIFRIRRLPDPKRRSNHFDNSLSG